MKVKLIIPGTLPGLNEYSTAERTNAKKAAAMKHDTEQFIGLFARRQLRGVRFHGPVVMHYRWVEPNRRRDKDNIAFAKKFVQDALVKTGVLENDGWAHVAGFTDAFDVDKGNPRVEVVVEEIAP